YPAVLAVLLLPWSLLLVAALRRRGQATVPASPFHSLWIWWAVAISLFFSAPATKLVGYILPAVPPLALLAGSWLAVPGRERWLRGGALLAALVCVGGVFGARQWDTKSLRELPPVMRAAAAADPAWRDVPMVFIEAPHFEVPLLLDAKVLPWVVKNWDDPKVQQIDSWPKELFDAARFDLEQGRRVLLKPQDLLARLCTTQRAWILAPLQWKAAGDWINALPEQARERETRLLRWDAANKGPAAPEQICQAGHGDQHQGQ
ncbi:MAG TPA: hypothetical protein VFV25_08765, partial [Methylibium sp.]